MIFQRPNNQIVSIITLNVNGFATSIRRQRLSYWIKKQEPIPIIKNGRQDIAIDSTDVKEQ